jgi:hypothetical protein
LLANAEAFLIRPEADFSLLFIAESYSSDAGLPIETKAARESGLRCFATIGFSS